MHGSSEIQQIATSVANICRHILKPHDGDLQLFSVFLNLTKFRLKFTRDIVTTEFDCILNGSWAQDRRPFLWV